MKKKNLKNDSNKFLSCKQIQKINKIFNSTIHLRQIN